MTANLVRVLARQSRHPVGLIPFATVEAGGCGTSSRRWGACAEKAKGCDRRYRSGPAFAGDRRGGAAKPGLRRRVGAGPGPRPGVDRGEACTMRAAVTRRLRTGSRRKGCDACRQLLAGDARADTCCRKRRCLCCGWMSRECWRASPLAAEALELGDEQTWKRPGADRQQRHAARQWPRCRHSTGPTMSAP